MADNKIEIIASLDIPKSKHNIAGELKQLQADIQTDKSMRPKIIAGLDISKSKTLIQSQLNTIVNQANAPTIKVGIDVAQTKNIGATINEQLSKTNASSAITDKMVNDYRKYFQLVGAEASEINGKLKPLLTSFANAFNTENVEQYYAVLKQIVDLTTRMSKESVPKNVNELISATKAQVTDGSKVYIDSRTRGDLKNMIGDAKELHSLLDSVFGVGKWTYNAKKGGTPFDTLVSPELLNRCNGLADCITNVHSQIIALKGERVPLFEGMSNAQIQSTIELYTQELLKLGLTTNAMDNNWVDITNGINTSTQAMSSNATQMANVQQVYANTSSMLQQVKQDYAQLYGVQSKDVSAVWNRDSQDNIKGFTVEVTKAKGIVESFKYELDNVSNSMQYIYKGGRGSDKGIANVEQGLEKLKTKYASFLSSNNSILSGLSQPIKDFETTLNNVGNSSSLKHAEAMFERLKQSASEISRYLSPTNSSFNKNDNAINHYRNMDNILKEMSSTFNNLVIKPEMLKSELDGVKSKISELQNLEKTEGGTTSIWAKKYAEVNLELERVRQNILMAAKAESASQKASKDSAYQTQLHYLDRVKDKTNEIISLKKKMVSAGIQESNLYNDEIIKKEKLIQYDIKQLAKKELLTDEARSLLNVYKQQREIQDKINSGKYNSKTQSGIATQINSLTNLRNSAIFKNNTSNNEVVAAKNQINDLILKYEQFKTLLNDTHDVKSLYKLKSQFNDLEIETQEATSAIRVLQDTLREQNITDNVATRATKMMTQIRKLKSDNPLLMNDVYRSSGKTYRDELDGMLESLKKCTDTKTYNKIRQNLASVEDSMKQTGKTGKGVFTSLLTNVKKFLGWMGMTTIVMRFVRSLKSMVSTVIELDTALTDLKKTFTGTEQDLNAFYSSANATAKELGVSTKEIIEQASAWSRLGFSTKEAAEEMAKNTAIFKTISPGMDADTATDGLVSMMKAYEIGYDEVLDGIISKVNVVGNKMATDNTEIVNAMTRSSSAMAAANNTLEQTIALNTASVEITRNAETTANAWKTVSMRLRSYDEETEELSDDLKTIAGDIADLTKVASNNYQGISLFTDEDKETYKSTYEIIKEISEIWDELSDKNQAELCLYVQKCA